jgi:hypothetical protein
VISVLIAIIKALGYLLIALAVFGGAIFILGYLSWMAAYDVIPRPSDYLVMFVVPSLPLMLGLITLWLTRGR